MVSKQMIFYREEPGGPWYRVLIDIFFLWPPNPTPNISPKPALRSIGKVVQAVPGMAWSWLVPQFAFYGCTETLTKASWGGKHLFRFFYAWAQSILGEVGQKLKQEPGRNQGAGLLTGLLSRLLIQLRDHLPRGSTPDLGWAVAHLSLIKKMPLRLAHMPIWEALSQLRLPIPRWPWLVSLWTKTIKQMNKRSSKTGQLEW